MRALLNRDLWRESLRVEREQLLWWPAVRMLLGIALIYGGVRLAIGPATAMSATTGALMVSLAALGGPSRVRTQMALAMGLLLGLAVSLGMLLSPYPLLVALVAAVWTAAFALLGAAHPIYQTVAALSISYLVSHGAGESSAAWWVYGLIVAGGGLAQLGYLSFLWPLRPFAPERTALADVLRAVAAGLRTGVDEAQPGLVLHHAPALGMAQVLAAQNYAPAWAEQHRALIRLLDDTYLLDAAVCGLLAQGSGDGQHPPAPDLAAAYAELAGLLDEFAAAVAQGEVQLTDEVWPRWEAALRPLPGPAGDTLRAAACRLRAPGAAPELPVRGRPYQPLWAEVRRAARDRQTRSFALFFGGSLGLLTAAAAWLPWENTSWLVLNYALIFTADFHRLLTKGLARVSGMLLGLGTVLALEWSLGLEGAAAVGLLALAVYLTVATARAGYAPFTLGLTLFTFSVLGGPSLEADALDNLQMTVAGVALAALAYYLWPVWKQREFPEAVDTAAARLNDLLTELQADAPAQAHSARLQLLALGQAVQRATDLATASRNEPERGLPGTLADAERQRLRGLGTLAARALGLYAAAELGGPGAANLPARLAQLQADLLSSAPRHGAVARPGPVRLAPRTE